MLANDKAGTSAIKRTTSVFMGHPFGFSLVGELTPTPWGGQVVNILLRAHHIIEMRSIFIC